MNGSDRDVTNAHPELVITSTHVTGDFPTDIAAGPDQTPVQLKVKFPVTLKANKQRSFQSEWYRLCCILLCMSSFYYRTWDVLGNLYKMWL